MSKDTEYIHILGLGAAIQNILLAANSLGLASCWCGVVQLRREVEKILGIKENGTIRVYSLISIGYSTEKPEPPPRKTLNEIVFEDEIG